MKSYKYLTYIFLVSIIFTACKTNHQFKLTTTTKTTLGKNASISLSEINGKAIDSVQFFVKEKQIKANKNSAKINTADFGVGKHIVTALVFYPEKTKKITGSIEVLADKKYDTYSYKIVNTYPHDKKAYTQGLEYYKGYLYETTGRRGESTLRKVDVKTGEVIQKIDLPKEYFGEGMTIFNNKIYWLTWQARKGFIYNVDTFEKEGEFDYNQSKEGWGLTHNNTELIKSDGSNRIWFLDPETKKEKRFIEVYNHKKSISQLNELEMINGKLYANYWQLPLIAIINPDNGVVEGIIDLRSLKIEMEKTQKLTDQDDVLNGIAFDSKNNRIFVTGKHWEKLFEIELIKQ
ncbi:MAG: glutaminyl-peptide cyclotransferase [Flavobacteriaceae bacterium]